MSSYSSTFSNYVKLRRLRSPPNRLSAYARHLRPLLREERLDEEIDISSLQLTHYRLKKIAEHKLKLKEGEGDYRLSGAGELGTCTARDPEKEPLSAIIERLNYMNIIKDKVAKRIFRNPNSASRPSMARSATDVTTTPILVFLKTSER